MRWNEAMKNAVTFRRRSTGRTKFSIEYFPIAPVKSESINQFLKAPVKPRDWCDQTFKLFNKLGTSGLQIYLVAFRITWLIFAE